MLSREGSTSSPSPDAKGLLDWRPSGVGGSSRSMNGSLATCGAGGATDSSACPNGLAGAGAGAGAEEGGWCVPNGRGRSNCCAGSDKGLFQQFLRALSQDLATQHPHLYLFLCLALILTFLALSIETTSPRAVRFFFTFDLYTYIVRQVLGYGVPVGFFAGFSFIPPLGKAAAPPGRSICDFIFIFFEVFFYFGFDSPMIFFIKIHFAKTMMRK